MTTKKTQTANGGGSFLDLRSQFIFYASYHNESVNVAIHLFCIWQLIGTLLALLQVFKLSYMFDLSMIDSRNSDVKCVGKESPFNFHKSMKTDSLS